MVEIRLIDPIVYFFSCKKQNNIQGNLMKHNWEDEGKC